MHCQKCGSQLIKNANFCKECGFAITFNSLLDQKLPTSALKRLSNYSIDRIFSGLLFLFFILCISGLINILVNSEYIISKFLNLIIGSAVTISFFIVPLYYLFFEGIWGRTLGKWITKTKVVRTDGRKPKFIQILGRSFARLIPFEAFSFLISNNPIGWHDRFSGTLVVPVEYTVDDVRNINFEEIKSQKIDRRLLIVVIVGGIIIFIAIIGILASTVLASLNSARIKAQDTSIKSSLSSFRVVAELEWGSKSIDGKNGSYYGLCNNTVSKSIPNIDNVICNDSIEKYAISAPLKSGGYFCVDSSGNSINTNQSLKDNTSCSINTNTFSNTNILREIQSQDLEIRKKLTFVGIYRGSGLVRSCASLNCKIVKYGAICPITEVILKEGTWYKVKFTETGVWDDTVTISTCSDGGEQDFGHARLLPKSSWSTTEGWMPEGAIPPEIKVLFN